MSKVIGLTGKACCGKNFIASILEEKGFFVIDVDKLGHQALEENKEKISALFENVLTFDNHIDRKKLGNVVFSSKSKLKELEQIIHPGIKKICIELINKEKEGENRPIILNAALLERGRLDLLCDSFIFVKANFFIRMRRTKRRDSKNLIWFIKRNLAQKDIKISQFMKKKGVFCIINNRGIDNIYRQVSTYCDILNISNC